MVRLKRTIRETYAKAQILDNSRFLPLKQAAEQTRLELMAISNDTDSVLANMMQIKKHTILYLSGSKEPKTLVTSIPIQIRRMLLLEPEQELEWKIVGENQILITISKPSGSENSRSFVGV